MGYTTNSLSKIFGTTLAISRIDWNGDGVFSLDDFGAFYVDYLTGKCPDGTVLLASARSIDETTQMEALTPEVIEYLEWMMERANLTEEQESALRLAMYGATGETILPKAFALSQNVPNLFNPSSTITYSVLEGKSVYVS